MFPKIKRRIRIDNFIKWLLVEVKEAKEKGDSEIRIFSDSLPYFLAGCYSTSRYNKIKTSQRMRWAWIKIQDALFCQEVRFELSMTRKAILVVKL